MKTTDKNLHGSAARKVPLLTVNLHLHKIIQSGVVQTIKKEAISCGMAKPK